MRILTWVNSFLHNCRKSNVSGSLATENVLVQRKFFIKREQDLYSNTKDFEISGQQLNLKMNGESIYKCYGCIQGHYLVFIRNKSALAEKLLEEANLQIIYEEMTLTMTKIRDQHWIPTLRKLVKRTIKVCYGC